MAPVTSPLRPGSLFSGCKDSHDRGYLDSLPPRGCGVSEWLDGPWRAGTGPQDRPGGGSHLWRDAQGHSHQRVCHRHLLLRQRAVAIATEPFSNRGLFFFGVEICLTWVQLGQKADTRGPSARGPLWKNPPKVLRPSLSGTVLVPRSQYRSSHGRENSYGEIYCHVPPRPPEHSKDQGTARLEPAPSCARFWGDEIFPQTSELKRVPESHSKILRHFKL